ncbi:TrmH family RNA methyltransferase [Aggregatibacter actinomycetemcomitans]|uniref:TrmH family RNA methyltransferase n=1 Tax=Aggregatibacter actinomycetemcomitans TaxID=714 RepID=UPI001E503C35|nr:TrmH family RNA methyltransferase [Aggregatibacter actinomycetemcomitans]
MNQHSNKPTFKSTNKTFQETSFNERSVGADRKKRDKNRLHFNAPNAARPEFKKSQGKNPPFKRADSQEKTLRISESTMKKAGGAEYVRVLETDDSRNALAQLRHAGYQIIHVSNDKNSTALDKVRLKNKTVFVLSEGSTETLAEKSDEQVRLSFGNPLKNGLNVSVNAGILLAKWYFR